jgi:hypothetical protein
MSDDLQFIFDSEISLNDTNEYLIQHNVLILNGKCCEVMLISKPKLTRFPEQQY